MMTSEPVRAGGTPRFSTDLVFTVARREFLSTVRRKAFLLTLLGTPAYFAFVLTISSGSARGERTQALQDLRTIGYVDSSGYFAHSGPKITTDIEPGDVNRRDGGLANSKTIRFETSVRSFPDQPTAEAALRAGQVNQIVIIPADYMETGKVRRYARSNNLFSNADRRVVASWLARTLVQGRVDSTLAARVAKPAERERLYALNRAGQFELKDDKRELLDFLLPMFFAMLLGLSIIIGGQYLLQGVSEEKESRILESLLCQVTPSELMAGKLIGLGSVGLLVIATWVGAGGIASGPMLAAMPIQVPLPLIGIAVCYFLLGYIFYGSMMTAISAVTNNMREAQQFSVWFTFANFLPFIMLTRILGHPNAGLAVGLSLFPPTAATAMMLRLTAPSSVVPGWQLALSMALLALTGWLVLRGAARIFRVGLLMYGKTPSLPEILRWATSA
jgi:ABC-2 type transport system permease protein